MKRRRLALIGCGRIGAPVLDAWRAGALPGWDMVGVLVRRERAGGDALLTTRPDEFFARRPELIVELAGPRALALHAQRALQVAPVWTVSAAALADDAVHARLAAAAQAHGHGLRMLAGAIAGLDGLATLAAAGDATLHLDIDLPPGDGPARVAFEGSVRAAAVRFPDHLNVAVAAALAGPGLDRTTITVRHPGPVPRHAIALRARSAAGELRVQVEPDLGQGVHPVACNVIAALRRELACVTVA